MREDIPSSSTISQFAFSKKSYLFLMHNCRNHALIEGEFHYGTFEIRGDENSS